LRPTPRSPSLYVEENSFRNVSTSVFHLKQSNELIGFGATPSGSFDKLEHLFASQGQLQIVETPFEEGAHVCTSSSQAVSLIQELKSLHKKGFSHGDIRAYNCVFSETGSHLIDFDFGGHAGTVTYPEGYQTLLQDGTRISDMVLERDRVIYKWHDVYALVKLFLYFHTVTGKGGSYKDEEVAELQRRNSNLVDATDRADEEAAKLLNDMEHFLKDTSMEPTLELKITVRAMAMESAKQKTLCGFDGTPEHRKKK
jgi:serine/threonine protein kinase